MLAKRIVPCLDVDRGRVVKGVNFVELVDAGDPVECGKRYDQAGADELVFLDITASSDARNIVANMVRRVADTVFIPFTVGGGIRSGEDIRDILRAGADKVSLNTAAVKNPELITTARKNSALNVLWWLLTPNAVPRLQKSTAPGRFLCTEDARPLGWMSWMGGKRRAPRRRRDPVDQHGSRRD